MEANLGLAQLTSSPQSLLVVAAVSKQNCPHSSQKHGTTGSKLGLLLPQDGEGVGETQWEGCEQIFAP